MRVIKSTSDWEILVKCTGIGFPNRHRPCSSSLIVEKNDIVRREYIDGNFETRIMYGVICMKCNCFTQIDSKLIPDDVIATCPTVAKKGTEAYSKLSVEEKVLSDKL